MKSSLLALASALCVLSVLTLGLWRHNLGLNERIQQLNTAFDQVEVKHKRQLQELEEALNKAASALAAAQSEKASLQLQLLKWQGADKPPVVASTQALVSALEENKLQDVVAQKYQLLWGDLTLTPSEREQLKKLLMDRERVLNTATTSYFSDTLDATAAVANQLALLADVDDSVEKLLDTREFSQYQLFKDSGFEQFQLHQFSRILGPDGSLTDDQRRQMLLSKLRHKQHFEQWLEKQQAPDGEKLALHDALDNFRQGYLQDVRGLISEHQFKVLQDYERVQFEQMQKSLQAEVEE